MGHRSLDMGDNAGGSVGKLNEQSSEVSLGGGVSVDPESDEGPLDDP